MTWTFSLEKNKEFVSGLFWNPLSGTPGDEARSLLKSSGKETQKLADEMNFNMAVWRAKGALQVGLGNSIDGVHEGCYSVAAAIADAIEEESSAKNFLCATEGPNGKWLFVAQRDGVILSEGDKFGVEDQIRSEMLTSLSVGYDWDVIYAPAHWGISHAEERTLEQLLPVGKKGIDYRNEWKLSPVKPSHKKNLILLIAIGSIGFLAYLGNQYYQDYKTAQRLAAEAAAALAAQQANPQVVIVPPWHEKPLARDTFAACMEGFDRFGSFWPGNWSPISADCRNGTVSAMWQRGEQGWIEHLAQSRPEISVSNDGSVASHSISLVEIEKKNNTESLPDGRMRTLEILSRAQRYGIQVGITEQTPPPALPGQQPAEQAPPQWREYQIRADGQGLPPEALLEIMDGNAFRLESVMMNFNAGSISWSMEGKQYVQP